MILENSSLRFNLRSEEEIIASWKNSGGHPKLSVACITYNHASYIEDAICSFLIQKTDFPIEIVIQDDASNDGTTDILRSYYKRYPRIIRLVIHDENQYSKGRRPFPLLYPALRGEYVAFCEGDDYWVDPLKLQKQVKYLDENPDLVASGHDARVVDVSGKILKESKLPDIYKRDFSANELLLGRVWILTVGLVFRRVISDDEALAERSVVKNGDNFLLSLLGQYGGSKYHNDIEPAVYRIHEGGVWSCLAEKERAQAQITTWLMIHTYYQRVGNLHASDAWWSKFESRVIYALNTKGLIKELALRLFLVREFKSSLRRIKKSW